jgi:fucose permease
MFWLPTILKASSSATNQSIGFLYGFFFVCAFVGMYAGAWFWRQTGDRAITLLLCGVVPFVTIAISAFASSPVLAYVMLCVAAFFIWGMMPVFWTLPAEYWAGATAAAAIAFINSFTGLGGLIGPWMVGLIKDATGKFEWAVFALAVAFLFQAGFTLALRIKKHVPVRA